MESLLKEYPNVLVLRVRMPIVADLTYPRNFITKIIKYEKVRSPGQPRARGPGSHRAPEAAPQAGSVGLVFTWAVRAGLC